MGKLKLLNLSEEEARRVKIFKALGNPTRLSILNHLAGCQPCMCGDIVADLPLAQSTVSQHLKVLRGAGLITGEVYGPAVCYSLNTEALDWFRRQVTDFVLICLEQTSS